MRIIPVLLPAVIGFLQAGYGNSVTGEVYLQKAEIALENKLYDQVILNCTKAIEADPSNEKAYAWRGYAHVEKHIYNQAVADCTTAVQLKPLDTEGYNSRAIAHLKWGAVDQAISDWTTVIRLKPDVAKTYNNRAGAYILKHQYDRALSDCNQAIAIAPGLAQPILLAELSTMTNGSTTMPFSMPRKPYNWIQTTLSPTPVGGLLTWQRASQTSDF
jgi:tetratricopeptide (TPR) repeat protein